MKSGKAKRQKRKRIRKVLLGLLLAAVVGLCVLLYGPVTTVTSLSKVDDYPLYVMRYRGGYLFDWCAKYGIDWSVYRKIAEKVNPDACTSFAALGAGSDAVFGRNFDWNHRSSLLLFTDPPGGYASVSMVDLYYLGLEGMQDIPWAKRINLLAAPYATIDGMNECGVAIAEHAGARGQPPKDPNKPTLLSSHLQRLVLDHAKDVDEALTLIQQYNAHFAVIPVHFHIADASGKSAIVEYVDGSIVVIRNDNPWQVSTNVLLSEERPVGATSKCPRYNTAYESLRKAGGKLSPDEVMRVLQSTSQRDFTVWSVVYNLTTGTIQLAMGEDYERVHTFRLKMKRP